MSPDPTGLQWSPDDDICSDNLDSSQALVVAKASGNSARTARTDAVISVEVVTINPVAAKLLLFKKLLKTLSRALLKGLM